MLFHPREKRVDFWRDLREESGLSGGEIVRGDELEVL